MLSLNLNKLTVLMLFSSTSLYASPINPFDDQINKCSAKNISEGSRVCLVNEQISSQNHFDTSDQDEVLQTVTRSEQIVYESNYLAPHIWKTIFLYLDKAALKSCRAVSRLFAGIILNTQNHPAHSFILKLSTISDFTAYLSHNRQYSLRGINITFAINDDTFVDKDLSHLVFLSGNEIGDAGATALAQGNLTNLTSLDFDSNQIGDAGATALARGNLTNLMSLNLTGNQIKDAGATALAQGNLTNLTSLNLRWNNIGAAGATALDQGNLTNLTSLDLRGNHIGAAGATALAQGNLTNLTSSDLSNNEIGAAGATALAQGNLTNLTSLGLDWNNIRDAGATALAQGNLTNLMSLNLRGNGMSDLTQLFLKQKMGKAIIITEAQ